MPGTLSVEANCSSMRLAWSKRLRRSIMALALILSLESRGLASEVSQTTVDPQINEKAFVTGEKLRQSSVDVGLAAEQLFQQHLSKPCKFEEQRDALIALRKLCERGGRLDLIEKYVGKMILAGAEITSGGCIVMPGQLKHECQYSIAMPMYLQGVGENKLAEIFYKVTLRMGCYRLSQYRWLALLGYIDTLKAQDETAGLADLEREFSEIETKCREKSLSQPGYEFPPREFALYSKRATLRKLDD